MLGGKGGLAGALRELFRKGGNLVGGLLDLPDERAEILDGFPIGIGEGAELIPAGGAGIHREVAVGHLMGYVHQVLDGFVDGTAEVECHEAGEQSNEEDADDERDLRGVIFSLCVHVFLMDEVLPVVHDAGKFGVDFRIVGLRGFQKFCGLRNPVVLCECDQLRGVFLVAFPDGPHFLEIRCDICRKLWFEAVKGDVDLVCQLFVLLRRLNAVWQGRGRHDRVLSLTVVGYGVVALRCRHDALQVFRCDAKRAIVDAVEAVAGVDAVAHENRNEQSEHEEQLLSDGKCVQDEALLLRFLDADRYRYNILCCHAGILPVLSKYAKIDAISFCLQSAIKF